MWSQVCKRLKEFGNERDLRMAVQTGWIWVLWDQGWVVGCFSTNVLCLVELLSVFFFFSFVVCLGHCDFLCLCLCLEDCVCICDGTCKQPAFFQPKLE